MMFLIVEDLLLTTNIEELRENSDRPKITKDGEYYAGSTLCLNPYLLHINYLQLCVAILADHQLLVISLVQYKAKMGTEMKDSVKCIFL